MPDRQAVDLFNELDTFAGLRNGLKRVADDRSDWAGIPMPMQGHQLIVEPNYPKGAELAAIGADQEANAIPDGVRVRNVFWSTRRRAEVYIWEEEGRISWGAIGHLRALDIALNTLDCSYAWGIEQEHNAVQLLGTLVRHHTFKQYLLTGMFLERSARSGLMYLFRRLKPTVVLSSAGGKVRMLCALCLHPIAYYQDSWAGAMTPTDDVVAHLMLMRGDEAMFWRRSNQHPPWRPEAGL